MEERNEKRLIHEDLSSWQLRKFSMEELKKLLKSAVDNDDFETAIRIRNTINNKNKWPSSEEARKIITDMGYCVKDIEIYSDIENIDKESYNPDKVLLVSLCNGEGKTFYASEGKIEEIQRPDINEVQKSDGNDGLPF